MNCATGNEILQTILETYAVARPPKELNQIL